MTTTPVLAVGQYLDAHVQLATGVAHIRLQRVTEAVWTVVVYVGTLRVGHNRYSDETHAGLAASELRTRYLITQEAIA